MADDSVEITQNQEAAGLAAALIAQWHEHLSDTVILYLSTTQAMTSRGELVLGKVVRLNPRERWLSGFIGRAEDVAEPAVTDGYELAIVFQADAWGRLTPSQRRAAVDHELAHVTVGADGTPKVRGHDLEEFRDIVERHGFWRPEVRRFAEVMVRQLPLFQQGGQEPAGSDVPPALQAAMRKALAGEAP